MVMVGILPTVTGGQLTAEAFSANPRYELLNEQIFAARGEDLDIASPASSGSPPSRTRSPPRPRAPACSCTCRSTSERSASTGTRRSRSPASSRPGRQRAVLLRQGAVARDAHPLFEQATDTRSEELRAQGVRPRVWFGERWITSIFDLFEENVRYFPALLPVCEDEDPVEVMRGDIPGLAELRLAQRDRLPLDRAGVDVVGSPHLRVKEPRAAAGPDGRRHPRQCRLLLRRCCARLSQQDRRLSSPMSFGAARRTSTPARDGIEANVYWPRGGVGRRAGAAPPAADGGRGLRRGGVAQADRDRLLGIIGSAT